jgi:putative ABC transport system permease protein
MLGDFRYACRQWMKSPVFAAVSILTLAVGVGANTAIFSVVKAVLLNQLPYCDPGRLVKIAESDPDKPIPETIDLTTTFDLRQRSKSFQSMSLFRDGASAIVEQGHPELLDGLRVNYDYFDTLGVQMPLGRGFLPRYKKAEVELNFYDQAMQRLRATPGIESVAMVSTLPLASFNRRGFHVQDRPLANDSEAPSVDAYSVSPDYFHVMRIPLKRGRLFTVDDRTGSLGVALISESCAQTLFPHEDPIGMHIQLGGRHNDKPWMTIVGIVGDIRQYGFDRPSNMEAYVPIAQNNQFGYSLVARTDGDPLRFEQTVRQAFLSVDNTQPIYRVLPLEDYVAESQAARRFTLLLLGIFGAVALILAAMGIYGVISYAVSLRTRELGIRMALGAARNDVVGMVLRQGLRLISLGLVSGFAASILLTQFLSSLLFQVRPADGATLLIVTLTLAAVALMANYFPARRASRVDPIVALRCE